MEEFLVFRLSAAMGSMGTLAGNERRGTDDWPSRSAIVGLLGAALGVRRSDREDILRLESDYGVGIARRRLGTLLVDYHTAQTVPTSVVKRPSSRRQALAAGKAKNSIGTIITHREYYQTCVFDVALTASEKAFRSLETVREALCHPRYLLYFGRKACPLDLPLGPRLVSDKHVTDALDSYADGLEADGLSRERHDDYLLDPALVRDRGWVERAITRRDGVADRERWLFADRESVLTSRPAGEKST